MSDAVREREALIAEHVRAVLVLLGLDPLSDPEIATTPQRVAELAVELTAGTGAPPPLDALATEAQNLGIVVAHGLPFYGICAHHFLPFFGRAHVGFLPRRSIVGIGSFGRVLAHFSRRPQLQERLGEQIAEYLQSETDARGVAVVLEARQLCMEMRGGRMPGTIETIAARGELAEGRQREEFLGRVARMSGTSCGG